MLRQENLQLRQQVDQLPDNLETLTKVNKQTLKPIFEDEQLDRDNQEENFPKVLQRKEMAKLMGISERSLDTKIRQAKKLSAPPVIEFEGKKWEYVKDANSNKKLFRLLDN